MSYGITRQSQIIDYSTIKSGCNKLKSIASDLKKYGESVKNISELCNEKALQADGNTNTKAILDKANNILKRAQAIETYATELDTVAASIYRKQNNEYASYMSEQKERNN